MALNLEKTTSSFFSKTNDVGTTHSTPSWIACPISTLNSAISNNIPSYAKIKSIKLHVTADFDCGMGLANVYLQYGFGNGSGITKHLLGDTKFTKTTPLEYPSGGVDITSYVSNLKSPFAITTEYGDYLTFRFYSENRFSKKYHINSATLDITYDELVYASVTATPPKGGTAWVSNGLLGFNNTVLFANPNDGYRFVGFYDTNGALVGTELNTAVNPTDPYQKYTAVFEEDSNVYRSTKKQNVYKSNKRVAVYKGTKKI